MRILDLNHLRGKCPPELASQSGRFSESLAMQALREFAASAGPGGEKK